MRRTACCCPNAGTHPCGALVFAAVEDDLAGRSDIGLDLLAFQADGFARVKIGSVSCTTGNGRGLRAPFSLSRILSAWVSDRCFTTNVGGFGEAVGSPNWGPEVGTGCVFSGRRRRGGAEGVACRTIRVGELAGIRAHFGRLPGEMRKRTNYTSGEMNGQ